MIKIDALYLDTNNGLMLLLIKSSLLLILFVDEHNLLSTYSVRDTKPYPQLCFNVHSNPIKQCSSSPFYWWRNWGSGKRRNLSSVLPVSERVRTQPHLCLTSKLCYWLLPIASFDMNLITSNFVLFFIFITYFENHTVFIFYYTVVFSLRFWSCDYFIKYSDSCFIYPILSKSRHDEFHGSHMLHNLVKVVLSLNV